MYRIFFDTTKVIMVIPLTDNTVSNVNEPVSYMDTHNLHSAINILKIDTTEIHNFLLSN